MKLTTQNKQRWWWVLGISTATAVVCLSSISRPKHNDVSHQTSVSIDQRVASSTASTGRVRKPTAEFYAEQKEKRIRRLLENITAHLPQQDQLARSAYFILQTESLADEDVPLLLGRLDESLRQSEFGVLLLRRWTMTNPQAAAVWVQALPAGDERMALLQQLATVWGAQDLTAANAWVSGLSDGEMRQTALLALTEETVRLHPTEALDMAGRLSPSHERDQLTIRALNEWATQEPVSALRWLARVDDPVLQRQMQAALIPVIANIDGASGAHLTVTWLKPSAEQERIAVAVVQRWTQQSPEAAAEWVNRFPAGAMRLAALENLSRLEKLRDAEPLPAP